MILNNHSLIKVMRELLEDYVGKEINCEAWASEYGYKLNSLNYPEPTILLRDITLIPNRIYLTDHVWFPTGDVFSDVKTNDIIQFTATVRQYYRRKTYTDNTVISTDYKLTMPKQLIKLSSNLTDRPTIPTKTNFYFR